MSLWDVVNVNVVNNNKLQEMRTHRHLPASIVDDDDDDDEDTF